MIDEGSPRGRSSRSQVKTQFDEDSLSLGSGRLPDFIIIGAQRCGTSSLYSYLIQHPRIEPAKRKEVHYFDLNFTSGDDWYRAHFKPLHRDSPATITGEASPYYAFHPLAAERCAQVAPNAKLIMMVRDPPSRAYSHSHHLVRESREPLSFEAAIDCEEERLSGEKQKLLADPSYRSRSFQSYSYLSRGLYSEQLDTWKNHFPSEQILVVASDGMFTDPAGQFNRVLDFLGLTRITLPVYSKRNAGRYTPMREETRDRLDEYFEASWRAMQAACRECVEKAKPQFPA